MVDFIVVAILLIIIGAAVIYIRKAKKRGVKCIGCPAGAECAHGQRGGCTGSCSGVHSCHTDTKK